MLKLWEMLDDRSFVFSDLETSTMNTSNGDNVRGIIWGQQQQSAQNQVALEIFVRNIISCF